MAVSHVREDGLGARGAIGLKVESHHLAGVHAIVGNGELARERVGDQDG